MKPDNKFLSSVLLCGCLFMMLSCVKEEMQTTYDSEEKYIDTFVSNKIQEDSTRTVTYKNGAVRLTVKAGTGDSLSTDGIVSFYYAGYSLTSSSISNSNLFATNHKETADGVKWNLSDTSAFNILTIQLDKSGFTKGLKNGLAGVKGGEECYILFSGKYGYGNNANGTIPAKSALAYHIWVESISNE